MGRQALALTLIEAIMRQKTNGVVAKGPWGKTTLADGDRVASPMAG